MYSPGQEPAAPCGGGRAEHGSHRGTGILRYVTKPQTSQVTVRRAARVAGLLTTVSAVLLVAGPASADVPQGWSDPARMSWLHLLMLILVIPVVMAIVISFLTILPGLVKGEGLRGRGHVGTWLGGPQHGTDADPRTSDTSGTGGASGRF